jgi:ribulose-bisphosphate carboxylase large chain
MKKGAFSCEWRTPKKQKAGNKSRLYRHKGNFTWQGIKIEKYKATDKGWANIIRQTLIGNHGETSKFHVRYFEIAPNGYSSLEMHKHEHVVICVMGKGKVLAGNKTHEMNFLDTVYVAPNTPHQLSNPFKDPFGFFCIVNAKRDRPKTLL